MAISTTPWTPPPRPDPSTLTNPPPFAPFTISTLRTGKVKPVFSKPGMTSAIYKVPQNGPVEITLSGLVGDEHAYEPHRHPDKAVHHYCSSHYAQWRNELPESAHLFRPGAFGENLYSEEVSEMTLCIGDRIALDEEVVLEVTEPRKPCYKLNHRFEVKDMAARAQNLLRTGWLYRVITPGIVKPGATFRLLERPHPDWSIARVMYYIFLERENREMMTQIVSLPALGGEIREMIQMRLDKGKAEDEMGRIIGGDDEKMDTWNTYRIVEKRRETDTVAAFVLEAVDKTLKEEKVKPGSHVRVKLGGKLVRAYSVVGGTSRRFTLGVALEPASRGGSRFLHERVSIGDVLTVSHITTSFPLAEDADKHIIIAGGIGITAFLGALRHLNSTFQKYELHYAVSSSIPFKGDVEELGERARVYQKSLGQRLDIKEIISRADSNTHIYCCGPERLMTSVATTAREYGVPEAFIHFETFTTSTSGDPFTAELKKSGKMVEVGAAETLLDALRKVGLDIDSSCEVGNCGTCRVGVCAGRIEHRGTGLVGDEKESEILSCVSRGVGNIVLDL